MPSNLHLQRNLLTTILLAFAFLAACGGRATPPGAEGEVFRPPPAVPQTPLVLPLPSPTATSSNLEGAFSPTATPDCINNLRFLEDLTIPDGTTLAPGAQIDKRWQVENSGTCNWDERYRLRLIAGPDLGAAQEQALYPARAGTPAEIRILFTAPNDYGTYRSAWQAVGPTGELFGDMIYIEIFVQP